MVETLKPLYSSSLKPVARLLVRLGIHPNIVTVAGALAYIPVAWLIVHGHWKVSVCVGIAGACMDGIDGVMAREFDKKSVFGAVLDSTCDRFTEILVFVGILVYYLRSGYDIFLPAVLCAVSLSGSLMVSYVKARAEGAGLACRGGVLQRPEKLIILGIFLLLGDAYMTWGLALVATLSYFTVIQRLIISFQMARRRP